MEILIGWSAWMNSPLISGFPRRRSTRGVTGERDLAGSEWEDISASDGVMFKSGSRNNSTSQTFGRFGAAARKGVDPMARATIDRRENGRYRARYEGPDLRWRSRTFDRRIDAQAGLRIGELAGLQLGDFDPLRSLIRVRRTASDVGGQLVDHVATKDPQLGSSRLPRVGLSVEPHGPAAFGSRRSLRPTSTKASVHIYAPTFAGSPSHRPG